MLLKEQNVDKDEHEWEKQHIPKMNDQERRSFLKSLTSILSPLAIRRRALIAPPHGAARFTIERIYFSLKAADC